MAFTIRMDKTSLKTDGFSVQDKDRISQYCADFLIYLVSFLTFNIDRKEAVVSRSILHVQLLAFFHSQFLLPLLAFP